MNKIKKKNYFLILDEEIFSSIKNVEILEKRFLILIVLKTSLTKMSLH